MSSVFSFGSVILDKIYTIPDGLNMMMSAKVFQTINEEIKLENEDLKEKGEDSIPEIDLDSTENVNDDRLYPVLERVAERLKGNLSLNEGSGGSVHNAQQALKATLGRYYASDIEMYHKPASSSDTIAFTINGRKIYGSDRPVKSIKLTTDERKKIYAADLITFPKSSINDYPSIVEDIIANRKAGSKIAMNVHSSNPIENMDLYRKADAWIGTVDEMNDIASTEVDKFLQEGGIVVETNGGGGMRIRYGDFDKNYPTTEVEKVVSKMGAGNGVEGVLFGHLLGKIGTTGQSLEKNMDIVANLGNAAASVVIGKKKSYLTEDDHGSILKNYRNIVLNNAHSLESKKTAALVKRSDNLPAFKMM